MRVTASCATTARFVFLTDATSASSSSGCSVRGSITSTEMPSSSAACFAASSERCTSGPIAITVTSVPSRIVRALPSGIGSISVRHLALDRVEQPVLEEDDRVVVVDRRPEQAAHVLGRRREHDLQARDVHEPRLELLRVLRARRPAGAALRADRQRHLDLAARHVAVLRRLVDDLLERERQEVLVHDLDDRAHARHRRADARADDRHLGDRRVAHALRAELVEQALRDGHRAAHLGDVLAHDEDVVVARASRARARRAPLRGR